MRTYTQGEPHKHARARARASVRAHEHGRERALLMAKCQMCSCIVVQVDGRDVDNQTKHTNTRRNSPVGQDSQAGGIAHLAMVWATLFVNRAQCVHVARCMVAVDEDVGVLGVLLEIFALLLDFLGQALDAFSVIIELVVVQMNDIRRDAV